MNRGELRVTGAEYKETPEKGTRLGWRRIVAFLAPLLPLLWLGAVFLAVHPLVNAPVADSWIYSRAVKRLNAGSLSLPGYTAAMPLLQIAYGALWARLFGPDYVSLYCSVILLGIAGGLIFYFLACRCEASAHSAALATVLLIFNPCYLFLSFSFMTDVPFMVLMLAAYLLFADSHKDGADLRLWLCSALLVGAFTVRVFAVAAIAGCAAAAAWCSPRGMALRRLLPFAAAAIVCLTIWLVVTGLMPIPWMLALKANSMRYLTLISVAGYLNDAVAAPLLYLGLVLSPLAVARLISPRWRRGMVIAAALALFILPLPLIDPGGISSPELSCCGGWDNVLVLRGPEKFMWTNAPLHLAIIGVGILGIAGLALAAAEIKQAGPGFLAVMLSTAIYFAGTVPLWLFNDRYYLVMVPAGCLILALAPYRWSRVSAAIALMMLLVLGWFAAAGVYDQQRGLEAVIAARDSLIRRGVPRDAIDAGYPLNGNDLYRDPKPGQQETFAMEAGIPLITTTRFKPYTIAAAPLANGEIIQRFRWPGAFGVGHRILYLLKTRQRTEPEKNTPVRRRGVYRLVTPAPPPESGVAMARLIAMAAIMLAPLAGVILRWLPD